MKYQIIVTTRFRKDIKLIRKQGKDERKLQRIVEQLANGQKLEVKYRDHNLTGDFEGFRECHIEPDWLLIYQVDDESIILTLSRTGSHSDLLF